MIAQIKERAAAHFGKMVEIRRHLHRHPELSFHEFETSAYVQQQLSALGIPYTVMADTGVVALLKGRGEGKVIALRADLDALPITEQNEVPYCSANKGVMHACGHDVHTASLLGVAMILNDLREHFAGTLKLIFQPGEEKLPGGASVMIREGVLRDPAPSVIIGQHVYPELEAGKVGFRPGKYMASADELYLRVIGRGGHAALPQRNIDPVLIASHIVVALQQIASRRSSPLTPTVLSFGKITGNGATNVIPGEVLLEGTFRTFDEEWRNEAHELIRTMAAGIARSMGGDCEVDIRRGYPFVYNDETLTARAKQHAIEYLGAGNVVDLDMRMTAEDFSYYSQLMPGCFYRLGTFDPASGTLRALHTPTFDVDERCLGTGSGLMAWLAIKELLQ